MGDDLSINEMIVKSPEESEKKVTREWFKQHYVWFLVPLVFIVVVLALEAFLIITHVPTYIFPQPSLILQGFIQEFHR